MGVGFIKRKHFLSRRRRFVAKKCHFETLPLITRRLKYDYLHTTKTVVSDAANVS